MAKRDFLIIIFIDLALFILTLLLAKESLILTAVYLIASGAILMLNRKDWQVYFLALAAALVVEPIMVHFGIWGYPIGNFYGVPAWIFLMWAIAAVSAYRAGAYFQVKNS